MSLPRELEPEIMFSEADVSAYAVIDHSISEAEFVSVLCAELGFRGGRVLDLGCGLCGISIALCRSVPQAEVVALDASAAMLRLAKEKVSASEVGGRIRLVCADGQHSGFPAGFFDLVISNNFFHHLAEPGRGFDEISRVCRKGGGLLIRDLRRPDTSEELESLLRELPGEGGRQRELLRSSLRAALLPQEALAFAENSGLIGVRVLSSGPRHWIMKRDIGT